MTAINVAHLSWKPGLETIIKDITTDFNKGVFYGIIGPNGSGKTSLLRHIMRMIEPPESAVLLGGTDIRRYKRKQLAREMSWVPQNTQINVGFTAHDIVMMGRSPYLKPFRDEGSEDRGIVRDAMELTHSWELRDKAFNTLSGGEAQRVIAARAIAQDTPVIILDEPISHLDIRHQRELMDTIKLLNAEQGKTILTVLHDLNLAAQYCTKLILLKDGQIFSSGSPEQVLSPDNLLQVYGVEFYFMRHPTTNHLYLIPK